MSLIGDLKEEIKELEGLAEVTSSFTEINSFKIKKIRASFERNRRFYEEIQAVYHLVNLYASGSLKPKKVSRTTPSGGTISLAFTSNSRFYGSLNLNVIDEFERAIGKLKTDLMIIGRTGIAYANSKKSFPKFEPIRFKKDLPSSEETINLIRNVDQYQKILVYYPKFVTIMSQKTSYLDLTQTIEPSELPEKKVDIIFEPEVEKMAEFFSQQIRNILFNRVVLETDLSWTSARLIAMNEASQKDTEMAKNRKVDLNNAQRALQNARLIETFSSLVGWRNSG